MKKSSVIEVDNVSFSYDRKSEVLKGISFVIEKGSAVMLIGPNGSGKTTLLKLMTGFLKPEQGKILVLGDKPENVRKKIGYVPQKLYFDTSFPITVKEFLAFSYHKKGDEKILKTLKNLDALNLAEKLIGELSGGQLQRVLIARALLNNPEILFLDEPVSGIDIGGEQNFYQLIEYIKKKYDVTVIMVSHEVSMVNSVADYVVCINKELLCSGHPEKALSSEIIEELYGKEASLYRHGC